MSHLKSKLVLLVLAAAPLAMAAPAEEPRENLEQDKAWAELAAPDNLQALRALVSLNRAPRHSVPFVAGRLKAMSERPARIGELIEDLDSWTPVVRDKAMKELETVADEAAPDLQKFLNGNPAPDVRQRVEQLLARRRTADALGARRTRILRALALLEVAGTEPARQTLETLARDSREKWLIAEAEGALKRKADQSLAAAWDDLAGSDPGSVARAVLLLNLSRDSTDADSAQIRALLQLAAKVPPSGLRESGTAVGLVPYELLPFRKDVLDGYKTDEKETPFRAAVRDGIQKLVQSDRDFPINETFLLLPEQQLNQEKRRIEGIQKDKVGDAFFQLGKVAEELEQLKEDKDKESRYWQAMYDYVLAHLYARQAQILEYSIMLGKIRRDDLPALNDQAHKGWKLATQGMISDRDAKEVSDKAKQLLRQLSKDHKGTPWEMIGRQEGAVPAGLMWVPLAK